ncbi:MAG: Ribosomal RNA large subunit methyltransferase H [uncultured bacterium (gcode 4)]|uniref:Ribosomal RNA large subunit methyltransferase H n=1 Tax=uncultured bacterium (gcode 4) TaxID=1234023 RepID=K1X4W5_9BACT|nr:MAG: Ribosomal RNA large subunit methyltransferase H [uncultured bacterium (gcode 4)]
MFTILSISDSDKHRKSVVEEYTKRLGKSVKIVDIKPSKNGNNQQIIAKDTETIIAHLQKFSDVTKIVLSKEGKVVDTMQFAALCRNKNLVFIIGWPYGLDEPALSKHIDGKISFGAITLPHGLAKVTLLEQIYRIGTIEQGKSYHY